MTIPKLATSPLADLYALIDKGKIEKDIVVRGKSYRLRSLFDEDYNWRDRFVTIDTQLAMANTLRAPTLAIATVALDGVPVEQIDDLTKIDDSVPQVVRDVLEPRYVIAYKLYTIYKALPRDYVTELYNAYVEDVEKVARSVNGEQVKNS